MLPIVDTHQHLWDMAQFSLPWLDSEGVELLRKNHLMSDYLAAAEGANITRTVYMEVDVAVGQRIEEAGASLINTGIGWHEARVPTIATMVPRAGFTWVTARLKDQVGIPLITSNRINMPETAEDVLARGDAACRCQVPGCAREG